MKFLKNLFKKPVYILLAVLLCMQLDWDFSHIKSFATGAVLAFSAMVTYFLEE